MSQKRTRPDDPARPDNPDPGKDRTSGHFGFCGHNDPVAFRNIQVKRLEKK